MNRVDIKTRGPIMENLAEVVISDAGNWDDFMVDEGDLAVAVAGGPADALEFILTNASQRGIDIVATALIADAPVYLDGALVPPSDVAEAFEVRGKVVP